VIRGWHWQQAKKYQGVAGLESPAVTAPLDWGSDGDATHMWGTSTSAGAGGKVRTGAVHIPDKNVHESRLFCFSAL